MRSNEEIEKEIEKGKEFIKKHPYSFFGTDNKQQFKIFLKIIEKARKGETAAMLYDFANDAYEDSDENSLAYATIDWLFENGDSVY